MVSRRAALLLLIACVFLGTVQCAEWQQDPADAPIEDQDDGDDTIFMQTTANFERRGVSVTSHIWSVFIRLAVGVLLILPAMMVYMGIPDSLQAASLSLSSSLWGRGGLRGSGGDTRRLTAASVATSNSSGSELDEAMLDQLLADADMCCDGAAPGLQTSFKMLPGAPVGGELVSAPDTTARAAEPVTEDVVDAILNEPAPDGVKNVLQTGLKFLKSAKQDNSHPAHRPARGAGVIGHVSEEVLDAIMNDVDPLEQAAPALQTRFELLNNKKAHHPAARDDRPSEAVVDAIMKDVSEETFGSTPALQTGLKLFNADNVRRQIALDDVVSESIVDAIMNEVSAEESAPSLQTGFKLLSTKEATDTRRGNQLVSENLYDAIMEDMSSEEASPVLQLQTGATLVKKAKSASVTPGDHVHLLG